MVNYVSKAISYFIPWTAWRVKNSDKTIYLTFDDGPHPVATPFVLEVLKRHNVKATFFCLGKNIHQYPHLFYELLNEGHQVGNHTYNHLNGYKTTLKNYVNDYYLCQKIYPFKLFRPPYGRITFKQLYYLKKRTRVVMWTVLSKDYLQNITPETCIKNILQHTKSGSILVFHDSAKAFTNLSQSLETCIVELLKKGYTFKTL
jgi:peptidoglycan/xylan/chitin deacetylase (PgdA/CDA1 family)